MAKSGQKSKVTFEDIKIQLDVMSEKVVKGRLEEIVDFAVMVSPVSTGAYVNSFSLGKAGFGGGRSVSSDNKPTHQDEMLMKQKALAGLYIDIDQLDIEKDLEDGSAMFTLRNSSSHVENVENGTGWKRTAAYEVFRKVKGRFS